jgi:hypothetical protein
MPNVRTAVIFFGVSLAVAFAVAPGQAWAWGKRAHAVINRTAIASLPVDGPVFLRKYMDYIGDTSTVPDTWRSVSEPFSKIQEDPNHGWFREQFAFIDPIPRSRYEFILALHREYLRIKDTDPETAQRTNVRWTGTLPYAAMESYGRLIAGMRLLRKAEAEGIDTRFLEQVCAFHVSQLGHYVGDGAQPLHGSIHSDGWRGDNPKGYTRDKAIHGRVESQFVDAIGLEDARILPHIPAVRRQQGDLFESVLTYLDESGSHVETIYQLDQRNAFGNPQDEPANALIVQQVAAGAAMLRDMVQRAWVESGQVPREDLPNPLDPKNPAYNPETGSAPALR